ncbi:MAG TPA: ROK family protein [Solirubrobacteraceae bacterium]|jgi:predicted NBD/HSP70 family sugar kinase
MSRALADLRSHGLIETADGGQGMQVRLSRRVGLVVGVDIGRTHARAAIADAHGLMIAAPVNRDLNEHPDDGGPHLLVLAAELISEAITAANESISGGSRAIMLSDLRAIGVGIPFPVSPHGATVGMFAPRLSGMPLAEILRSLLAAGVAGKGGLSAESAIVFAKDADLGVMALWRERRQARVEAGGDDVDLPNESLVFMKASFGIDAGVICHRMLITGGQGLAGQIGHMWLPRLHGSLESTIDDDALAEPPSPCPRCNSRYCLENVASGRAILAQLRASGAAGPSSVSELVKMLKTHQTERIDVRNAVIGAAGLIGVTLANAVRIADPTEIVVGGLLAEAGEIFMTPLRFAFAEASLPGLEPSISAVPPGDVRTLELRGALALALKHVRFEWV